MKLYTEETYLKITDHIDGFDSWIYQVTAVLEATNGSRVTFAPHSTEADDTKEAKEALRDRALEIAKKWLRLACERYPVEGE